MASWLVAKLPGGEMTGKPNNTAMWLVLRSFRSKKKESFRSLVG